MLTKTPSRTRVSIRWMVRRDMSEVLAIDNAVSNHPWSESGFLIELRKRNVIGMVAEDGDAIVGFMVYELRHRSIRILSFATCPTFSRQGIGTQMVAKLIGKLSPERRSALALHVRETNLSCQLFFRSLGFLATQVVRGHFSDTNEDAYQMEYSLEIATTAKESSIDA